MVELPEGLMQTMRDVAVRAGQRALEIQRKAQQAVAQKADQSYVTIADEAGEAMIREALAPYIEQHQFGFIGEETGQTVAASNFSFSVDPIDGTTNYTIGDPNWLVSIGILYKGEPVAGVTYQPALDKLYWAQQGQGAFVRQHGTSFPLNIRDKAPGAYVFNVTCLRQTDAEVNEFQRAIVGDVAAHTKALGEEHRARFRTHGCPSVPLCAMAEGIYTGMATWPVRMYDVAASYVIAKEAGAEILLEKVDPADPSPKADHRLMATTASLFPTLEKSFRQMWERKGKLFHADAGQSVPAMLHAQGITYGISVGRRQPMHRMHVDCIREMHAAGLKPVIVIGSTNASTNPYFNPLENPLTEAQQRQQIDIAMRQAGIEDYTLVSLPDLGDMHDWNNSLRYLLKANGIPLEQCVSHFRAKMADAVATGDIQPLGAGKKEALAQGFHVWESFNQNRADDAVSSRDFRLVNVEDPAVRQQMDHTLATPAYIAEEARQARQRNPDASLLQDVPITMLDLTLDRLRKECGMRTGDLLNHHRATSLEMLHEAVKTVIKRPGQIIEGNLAVTAGVEKGVAA